MSHLKCNTRLTRMKKHLYPLTQRGLLNQIVLLCTLCNNCYISKMCTLNNYKNQGMNIAARLIKKFQITIEKFEKSDEI